MSRAYHIWLSHDRCCSAIQPSVINAIPKMEAELPVFCHCVDTISSETKKIWVKMKPNAKVQRVDLWV